MPARGASVPAAASSISPRGDGAVPDGLTRRRTLAPARSVRSASRWVVKAVSRLSSTRAIRAPWIPWRRLLGGRTAAAAGQTGLRNSMARAPSARAPDRARDREAAEAAPNRQHGREVAAPAGDDDVDVLGARRDREPRRRGVPGGGG